MRWIISLIVLSFIAAFTSLNVSAQSPQDNTWRTLAKVTFKQQYDELFGFDIDVPVFHRDVRALEGKEVTLRGYIIPVEGYRSHREFVFSAYPYQMCFFCGGAGPETVMEVFAKDPIPYTAEIITIRGVLQLNDTDVHRLMYILNGAVRVN